MNAHNIMGPTAVCIYFILYRHFGKKVGKQSLGGSQILPILSHVRAEQLLSPVVLCINYEWMRQVKFMRAKQIVGLTVFAKIDIDIEQQRGSLA